MKYLFLVAALFFTGCAPHYIPYKVTSDVPHSSASTESKAVFIDGFSSTAVTINLKFLTYGYGILAVHDSGTRGNRFYVMFAPGSSSAPSHLDDVYFGYSSALLPDEIAPVLSMLDKTIKEWDVEETKNDGTFYSYSTHREAYIPETVLSNISIPAWIPALDFKYNRTNKGSSLTLFIGDENYQFQFTNTYLADVKALRDAILRAQQELKRMGMS